MFYCKAENKQTKNQNKIAYSHCLLSSQVWAGTRGPHCTTAVAFKLYDDCLHLNLALRRSNDQLSSMLKDLYVL